MKIAREDFLEALECLEPAIARKKALEQATCFVFRNGIIYTFDEDIACSVEFKTGIEGAIQADPLLNLMRNLSEKTVTIEQEGKKDDASIKILGKRKQSEIRLEGDIILPIDTVERPKKWRKLRREFPDAINFVQKCASTNANEFVYTNVHITPKFVETFNNEEFARYYLKTGFDDEILVSRDAIKHIFDLGMVEVSETENWVHFRNEKGAVLSTLRHSEGHIEEYMDLSELANFKGKKIRLPSGLAEAAKRAEVFSVENTDDNLILIEVRPQKLRVRGQGITGKHSETKRIKYQGPSFRFLASPQLIANIAMKYRNCLVSERKIKIEGEEGKWIYAAVLTALDDKDKE